MPVKIFFNPFPLLLFCYLLLNKKNGFSNKHIINKIIKYIIKYEYYSNKGKVLLVEGIEEQILEKLYIFQES